MTTAMYLDRFLEPVSQAFTGESARRLLDLRADPTLMALVTDLREKANEGTLTANEELEYKAFVEALDVISILQAKARRFVTAESPADKS